jgi:hypothetical protein
MPVLRKTGIRSPFLSSPLAGGITVPSFRQAILIGALVPSLLLGGNTQFVGRPLLTSAAPDTSRPAQQIIVQVPPVPTANALNASVAYLTRPSAPSAAEPHLAPTQTTVAQPSIPSASTQFVSRPAPLEDVQWPARPAFVLTGNQPISGGLSLAINVVRPQNTDPLRPIVVIANQPPQLQPTAVIQQVGTTGDETRLPLTVTVFRPPQPIPPSEIAVKFVLPRLASAPSPRLPPGIIIIVDTTPWIGARASTLQITSGIRIVIGSNPIIRTPTRVTLDTDGKSIIVFDNTGISLVTLTNNGKSTLSLDASGKSAFVITDNGLSKFTLDNSGASKVTLD